MNKFQPKIAVFGYEIMDTVSNGLRPLLNVSKKVNKYGFYFLDDRFLPRKVTSFSNGFFQPKTTFLTALPE